MSETKIIGNRLIAAFITAFLSLLLSLCFLMSTHAATYRSEMDDSAYLLEVEEKNEILSDMEPITKYCNIAFCSTNDNPYNDTQTFGKNELYRLFGVNSNSIVFFVDMETRKIQIITCGKARSVVTDSYCNTITDNIYRYATRGEYAKNEILNSTILRCGRV